MIVGRILRFGSRPTQSGSGTLEGLLVQLGMFRLKNTKPNWRTISSTPGDSLLLPRIWWGGILRAGGTKTSCRIHSLRSRRLCSSHPTTHLSRPFVVRKKMHYVTFPFWLWLLSSSLCLLSDGRFFYVCVYFLTPAGMGGKGRVGVVVLGDLGRSPRMQYHALSLANSGFQARIYITAFSTISHNCIVMLYTGRTSFADP